MELQKEILRICKVLNRKNVKYILVGGCAVIFHGYYRTTHDIDRLVDSSAENVSKIKEAFHEIFNSEEVHEIQDGDIDQYAAVRFAPEFEEVVIGLIGKIGTVDFSSAIHDIEEIEIEGVKIPLCGLSTLIETKKGIRPKDQEDLLFLKEKRDYLDKLKEKRE